MDLFNSSNAVESCLREFFGKSSIFTQYNSAKLTLVGYSASPNFLVVTIPITRAYLIDFEWAGVEGEAEYPTNVNLAELYWVNIEDLPKNSRKHDSTALLELSKSI